METTNNGQETIDSKQLKAIVERRHPEYESRLPHWNFLSMTYEGGRDWFKINIFKYFKEGEQEYKDRIERAYRFNHTREVVNMINKYIFKEDIYRKEDAPDYIREFWTKATKQGQSIDEFMSAVDMQSSVYGRIWAVVDCSSTATQLISVSDEKHSDTRVYVYWVPPQQMLDIAYDDSGNIMWALIREVARDDDDPFTCTGKEYIRYRLWTKDDWYLIQATNAPNSDESKEQSYEIVASGRHGLGLVPVIPIDCFSQFTSDFHSPSLIDDIAYLDRAVANYLSNLDAIIQDQTFSQLIIPEQSLPDDAKTDKDALIWGTKRVFTYNGEYGLHPEYISPDSKQANVIISVVKSIINEIYHSVGVAGERTKQDNAQGIDNSSGVAKAYDFKRVDSLLVTKSDRLCNAEKKILELVVKWLGKNDTKSNIDDYVIYPTTFDSRGISEELDIASQLEAMKAPKKLRQYQMRTLAKKVMPNMTSEQQVEFEKDLKGFPENTIVQEVIDVEKDRNLQQDSKKVVENEQTPIETK